MPQRESVGRYEENDPIEPVRISHSVDEVCGDDGMLRERYNFIDYEFELGSACARARSYAEEFDTVVLHGPFDLAARRRRIEAPELEAAVVAYLKRRFSRIERLKVDGVQARPYETLWLRAKDE